MFCANLIFCQHLSEKDKVLALANSILEDHIGDAEEVENTEAIIFSFAEDSTDRSSAFLCSFAPVYYLR